MDGNVGESQAPLRVLSLNVTTAGWDAQMRRLGGCASGYVASGYAALLSVFIAIARQNNGHFGDGWESFGWETPFVHAWHCGRQPTDMDTGAGGDNGTGKNMKP
jgi:hypothetical protein